MINLIDNHNDFLGLNIINRKLAKSLPASSQLVKLTEFSYSWNTIIPFKTHQQIFVPDEETDLETIDGRKITNIFTIDGNVLTEKQIEPNRQVIIVRQFFENEMLGEATVGDVRTKFWSVAEQ